MGEVQDFIKLLSRIHIFSDTNWLFLLHNLSSKNPMPRGARLDAPGTLRHVMVRGIEGHRIVIDDEDRFFCVTHGEGCFSNRCKHLRLGVDVESCAYFLEKR